ncbi:hypothetical protein BLNAU_18435 [Blattamonas nauphoetae]|uniref:B30.2/SPRY domain-containing protein n=1 Tax=Blattamonas nauphoetae TaxID=2049346 RepID=A0ABQ9X5J2_9EUKA|nr:hypothetical protein BLNAU_18435 [Blattamonas nauphoetae]
MGNALWRCLVCQDKRTYQTENQTNSPYYSASLLNRPPRPLPKLPLLDFTNQSHFSINRTIFTRTAFREDDDGYPVWSSVVLSKPFTSGIISITITILSTSNGYIRFGLMDSTSPIPKTDKTLGLNVENSVSLDNYGTLWFSTPSSDSFEDCTSFLKEGACLRMEVDLDSTPRTLQFFKNGRAGQHYMSELPSSVRIGFSVWKPETSFRIDNISRLSQPTPISDEMMEVKW